MRRPALQPGLARQAPALPLILFMLPCLFIVLAGPAGIRILNFSAGLGSG